MLPGGSLFFFFMENFSEMEEKNVAEEERENNFCNNWKKKHVRKNFVKL